MHTAPLLHSILVQACLTCRHPRAAGPSSCTSSAELLTVSWLLPSAAASTFCRVTCMQQWEALASCSQQDASESTEQVSSREPAEDTSRQHVVVPRQQLQADLAHLEGTAGIKAQPQLGCHKAQIPASHVRGNA